MDLIIAHAGEVDHNINNSKALLQHETCLLSSSFGSLDPSSQRCLIGSPGNNLDDKTNPMSERKTDNNSESLPRPFHGLTIR